METPYRSSRIADLSAEDRPREKALAIGVEALTTTELVALLLGSGTPGESVINLSQRILADSGNSLQELSRRTIRNLVRSFKGVGDAKAVTLLAAIELGKRYAQEGPVEKPVINMPSKAYDLMLDKLTGLDHEEFWVIYLNTAKRVITRARISQGGVAATVVDVKIVLRHAIDNLASAIILVHNHPSGSLRPSAHDDALTDKLKNAAKLIDVCVRQIPALNSDFAKKVANLDTMDQLRAQVRQQLHDGKHAAALNRAKDQILTQLADASEGELPSVLVETTYQQQMEQIQQQLQMQRLSLDRYLSQIHETRESFTAKVRAAAEKNTRARMALLQIAQQENLLPTDEEIDKQLAERAEKTKKTVEEIKAGTDIAALRRNEGIRKAADWVIDHSTIEEKVESK